MPKHGRSFDGFDPEFVADEALASLTFDPAATASFGVPSSPPRPISDERKRAPRQRAGNELAREIDRGGLASPCPSHANGRDRPVPDLRP